MESNEEPDDIEILLEDLSEDVMKQRLGLNECKTCK
jgi:hypothetical protein